MATDFESAVQELAVAHASVVEADLQVFRFPPDDEIRLVEISDEYLATGEVWPITFGKDPDIPFRSTVIQLTRAEWQRVLDGDEALRLPSGWDLAKKEQVLP